MALPPDYAAVSEIQDLHTYWMGLAGGAVPERRQIDPADIRPLLPYICIVDFETDPFRVRYRLSGSKVDEFNGFSLTGCYLDDLVRHDATGGAAHILDYYHRCWKSGEPVCSSYLWPTHSGSSLTARFAMFPLKLDGILRQCIGIEVWDDSPTPVALEAVPLPKKG